MNENAIGKAVVDAAVQVHREPGPGLLETYLKLEGLKLGLLLHFGSRLMKEGIEGVVNGLPEENLGVLA